MAGLRFNVQTIEVDSGTTKKTILQILAPANQRVLVSEISVSCEGIVNTGVPMLVEIEHQSTAGAGGDVLTGKKINTGDDEAIQTTALSNIDGSSQPTVTQEIMGEKVHPQGAWTWQAPFGKEIVVKGGQRLGISVTSAAAVDVKARFGCEE